MSAEYQTGEFEALDEGSWVYLSAPAGEPVELCEKIVETCEASGWFAVTRPGERDGKCGGQADPGHFLTGVRHAVEHADVVVVLLGDGAEMADVELAIAYSHQRPVVAVRLPGVRSDTRMQTMLKDYKRGRVLDCASAEECAIGLRAVFTDPDFSQLVRLAK